MHQILAIVFLLALSRAEIIERFKSPVITQAEGFVQVYADCPEDMRREYQMPIASFAADSVRRLYRGLNQKSVRFKKPGVVIHIGDVRTNLSAVVTRVSTNDGRVVSRIYLPSPGFADIDRLRAEIAKGFYRSLKGVELDDAEAQERYLRADPDYRVFKDRARLETWLREGRCGDGEMWMEKDEDCLRLMRKVLKPGKASVRDVLTFAARLYLYPPQNDLRFLGLYDKLSFAEALKIGGDDPCVRLRAALKANELMIFGGGKGDELQAAANAYRAFLVALARREAEPSEIAALLDEADIRLNVAYEEAVKYEKQQNYN